MATSLQILDLAAPLLGTLNAGQTAMLHLVIEAVQEEIGAQLRPDVDPEECDDSVTLAAVLLTVSAMQTLKDTGISDFTAGTLKVSLREDHSSYVQMADRLLAPWRANTTVFRGVSG